ncbi:MAG: TRAP transporter TatT component family protein [bacterium]
MPSTFILRRDGWKNHTNFSIEKFRFRDPKFIKKYRDLPWNEIVVQIICTGVLFFSLSGCAIQHLAVNSLAHALTEGSTSVYATDDDPELVGEALPFALKTIETLLQTTPRNKDLLISAAAGFVQYAHAFVLQPAQTMEFSNLAAARAGRERAKRLFIRARNYGLRALELSYPGISQALNTNPITAVAKTKIDDVPVLYWTGTAWGSAISVSKNDMMLVGDLPIVSALLERALELNESWGDGAIHEFFIIFDAGRSTAQGGGLQQAEKHFERAMELNYGQAIAPLVAFAESVCVQQQDRARFKALLKQALAFDPNQFPQKRLANILAQRKAAQLLKNIDHLFFQDEKESVKAEPFTNN